MSEINSSPEKPDSFIYSQSEISSIRNESRKNPCFFKQTRRCGNAKLIFRESIIFANSHIVYFPIYITFAVTKKTKKQVMDSIKNRRTIRKYKQQDIPDDLLNGLLEEAFRAPTMGNMQLYSVIVTRDPAMKERLAPAHFHQPMLTEAPVVLTFCADFNRFVKWCRQRKAEPGYDNLLSFMNASIDAIMLTQNFCTLAEAAGLGTCFLGTTIYNPDQIIEVLNLPERVIPLATITVGYPDECPPQTDRLPLEGIIHQEQYHDYSPEDIDRIYAYKESLPENKHFVEINHTETLAQIFTDIRYTKEGNEAMSKVLKETLRKQRFDE